MLTRFEEARIIGARSLQISMGAPVLIKDVDEFDSPFDIVKKEIKKGVLPLVVVRRMPNDTIKLINIKGEIVG